MSKIRIGSQIGRWHVLECISPERQLFRCRCLCGSVRTVHATDITARHNGRAPGNGSPEYRAWQNAKARCYRRTDKHWKDYGGRGIKMCERWRKSFAAFYADVGKRPSRRHSLDRRWNNGDYEPGNVRWATPRQQSRNRRPKRKASRFTSDVASSMLAA